MRIKLARENALNKDVYFLLKNNPGLFKDMSEIDGKAVEPVWKSDRRWVDTSRFFFANGMPADLVEKIAERGVKTRDMVRPYPSITTVADGQEIALGDKTYKALYTPGHTDGHMCLYNQEESILLSGDLPNITSKRKEFLRRFMGKRCFTAVPAIEPEEGVGNGVNKKVVSR
ncbi:hypothetical protein SY88_15510 [Clostridiales bacterium PH28_bin88]|nr:hypothetical protein SY88_15510 [Clostridiales bacterium PH28_bin88]